jgi:peroxiredoxin/uncharacterized membrane protein YphA (DoxX/SURF4 family)
MDAALVVLRLLLALVFFVAGIAKLADQEGSRKALTDFGVPALFAVPLSSLLALAELVVAIALISSPFAWWGAVGATTLLTLFTLGIAVNLARGKRPDCHCFGQLHSTPIGWPTLLRNGLLVLGATSLVVQGPTRLAASNFGALVSSAGSSGAVLVVASVGLVALLAEGWILWHLMRQNGRLFLRMDALEARLNEAQYKNTAKSLPSHTGLPLGVSAPHFQLADLFGNVQTLDDLTERGKAALLLFSDPNCGPCSALLPEIARWQQNHAEVLSFALISRGTVKENRAKTSPHGLQHILLQKDREVAQAYLSEGTPSAVLVLPNGTIGSPLVSGKNAIEALVAQMTQSPARPAGLPLHTKAPEFTLPDLKGEPRSLSEFRGKRLLLIFFNPRCGYCTRMAPDLAALPIEGDAGFALPIVVTTGSAEDNRRLVEEQGLLCPVLLQQKMEVASLYQAGGTPAGYLIDEQGHIVSALLTGAKALLDRAAPAVLVAVRNGEAEVRPNPSVRRRCQCGKSEGQCACNRQTVGAQRD